jgi:glucose/arabinose dehydrogenase
LLASASTFAQTYKSDEHSFRVVQVVKGLEQPWSLAFLPDGRMLVTEKAGRLRMIANGKLEPEPIAGLPRVTVHGQGGLHDVVPHPDFSKNSWVYLAPMARGEDAGTSRGGQSPTASSRACRSCSQSPKGHRKPLRQPHRVRPRRLHLTLGDRGEMPRAQTR